jgi:hypothetical protein
MSGPAPSLGEQLTESIEVRTLLAQIQHSEADARDALAKARGSEGGLVEFRDALCQLRRDLKRIQNCFLEYDRAIDRMYIHGSAPREAISKVDALIKTNLRTLNLIWDLPSPRTEEP